MTDFPGNVTPFDRLEPEALAFLTQHLREEHFTAGAALVSPAQGEPEHLFIVGRGTVRGQVASAPQEGELVLTRGDCFPVGALSGRRPSANRYVADTDVVMFLLPAARFHELMVVSPAFSRFCSGYLSRLVSESRRQLQAHFTEQTGAQQSLHLPLHQLIKRAPVSVTATATIQRAVELMGEQHAGSVIIVSDDGVPRGLLTQSDVVRRVVLGRVPLERPVTEVMTPNPTTLPEAATAADAMVTMASRGIRHLPLVDGAGRLRGVVSERDLFALQRVGLSRLRRAIETAADTEALQQPLRDVRQAAFGMLAQGVGAEQVTQFISSLNDAVTSRVIAISARHHALDDVPWAWLAFGSEGRTEQTFFTDQDNGLVFLAAPGPEREAVRARLLAFAGDVNQALDRCGFPLCKGHIMAGNPSWCLTLEEWKARFSEWITRPHPEALLHATIFFDFRAIAGRSELAAQLHAHLLPLAGGNDTFLRLLAASALTVAPPLGLIRDFVTERDDDGRAFVDLKKFGSRLFVDAARVLALANGIDVASTLSRLRRTAKLPGGAGDEVDALGDAFNFLQLLRLRRQQLASDNRILISELNQLDRRILKAAFGQAKNLQLRLKLTYQL